MMYLIGEMSVWLLLTALAMAAAGWWFAAERAAPGDRALTRERENLVRDLAKLASGDAGEPSTVEAEREADAMRRLATVREGRIAELERALGQARTRVDELTAELAEAARGQRSSADIEELTRLRALVASHEEEKRRVVDAPATPVEDEAVALQGWRLRYFEQRVRYLESRPAAPQPAAELAAPAIQEPPIDAWRAREAEARAAHLEEELRRLRAAAVAPETEPFAANADVDALLRWRMLYLERRVAHLQTQSAHRPPQPVAAPVAQPGPDHDRWKWRARYLEARVRHLEQRPVAAPQPAAAAMAESEPPAPAQRARRSVKPPVLASARNGAPDDFTLIENVSQQQQLTLNAIGVFHFDQIAAWTPENVAWIDAYFRLGGRVENEEWVEQAADLARDGVAAARRIAEEEPT